jgi:hypothetical protein
MSGAFVLAVVSALDAGLLTAAVGLLGRPQPPRQLGAHLIGGMGFSIIVGLVIVLSLHGSNLLTARVQSIIEVVAGALLVVVAVAVGAGRALQWHPRRKGKRGANRRRRQSFQDRALGNDSSWIASAAGAVYSAPGAYYVAGLALLVRLKVAVSTSVLAVLGFQRDPVRPDRGSASRLARGGGPRSFTHREAEPLYDGPPPDLDRGHRLRGRRLRTHLRNLRPRVKLPGIRGPG